MLLDPTWTEPKVDAVGEVLLEAADLLETRGWCQGIMVNEKGQMCLVGSIKEALWKRDADCGINYDDLTFRLKKYIGHDFIPSWNDEIGRTQAQAIEALRAAAWLSGDAR